jgi:hypothetical protein
MPEQTIMKAKGDRSETAEDKKKEEEKGGAKVERSSA